VLVAEDLDAEAVGYRGVSLLLFRLTASENGGHQARAAPSMNDCYDPERAFFRGIGYEVFADHDETEGA
jgi:hypothetical protein